jgi:hypothetical protein
MCKRGQQGPLITYYTWHCAKKSQLSSQHFLGKAKSLSACFISQTMKTRAECDSKKKKLLDTFLTMNKLAIENISRERNLYKQYYLNKNKQLA